MAILWSTEWDDAKAAARFEADAIERGDCLRGMTLEPGLGRDVVVRREGRRVAYVQGLGAQEGEVEAFALLAVAVETPPPRPPFGAITIPPLVVAEEAFLHQGVFDHGAWVSEPLGIRMPIPSDFAPDHESTFEAAMKTAGAHAAFELLMTPPSKETDELFLRRFLAATRNAAWMKDQSLDYVAAGPMKVDGVYAPSHTWRTTKGSALTLAFAPACDGKATVVIVVSWAGLDGALSVEDWVGRFKRPDPRSEVCSYLRKSLD
jgi:hypothetical protein